MDIQPAAKERLPHHIDEEHLSNIRRHFIDWNLITRHIRWDEDFISRLQHKISWKLLCPSTDQPDQPEVSEQSDQPE